MPQRDDFNEAVKRTLAARVGGLCSNPGCRALTSGPHEDAGKAVNLGVAAHITAAAPGGPRFDAALTVEQRASVENAIWLCQNCAKLIDNDPGRFPVTLLREWKATAEEEARSIVGKTATVTPRTTNGSTFHVTIQNSTVGSATFGDGAVSNGRVDVGHMIEEDPPTAGEREAAEPWPLVALGPHVLAEGRRIAASGNRWVIRLHRFLVGDTSTLSKFGEAPETLPLHDRYIIVSEPDDGRVVEGALTWRAVRNFIEVEVTVCAPRPRIAVTDLRTMTPDLTEARGIAAGAVIIRYCLATSVGAPTLPDGGGCRIAEWLNSFDVGKRLNDLVRLELVRLASIPRIIDMWGNSSEQISLEFVERVASVHARIADADQHAIPVDVEVRFVGTGNWKGEIMVAREPADPEAHEKILRELMEQISRAGGH